MKNTRGSTKVRSKITSKSPSRPNKATGSPKSLNLPRIRLISSGGQKSNGQSWSAFPNRAKISPSKPLSGGSSHQSSQTPRSLARFSDSLISAPFSANTQKNRPNTSNHVRFISSNVRNYDEPFLMDSVRPFNPSSLAAGRSTELIHNLDRFDHSGKDELRSVNKHGKRRTSQELDEYLAEENARVLKLFGGGYEIGPSTRNLLDNDETRMRAESSPVYPVRGDLKTYSENVMAEGLSKANAMSPSPMPLKLSNPLGRFSSSGNVNSTTETNKGAITGSKRGYRAGFGRFWQDKPEDEQAGTNHNKEQQQTHQQLNDATIDTSSESLSRHPIIKSSSSLYMSSYNMKDGQGDFNVVRGYSEDNNPAEYKVTRGVISGGTPKVTKSFITQNPSEIAVDKVSEVQSSFDNKRQRILEDSANKQNQDQKFRQPESLKYDDTRLHHKIPEPFPQAADAPERIPGEPDHLTHCVDGICITAPKKPANNKERESYSTHFD